MQKFQTNSSVRPSELLAFEQWRANYSRECFRSGGLFILILIFMVVLGFADPEFPQNIGSLVGIFFVGSLFAGFAVLQFVTWHKSRAYTLKTYGYGMLKSKSHESKYQLRRHINHRNHYLTVSLGNVEEEATCDAETYRNVQLGDLVFVFTTDEGRIHALLID